MFKSAEAAPVDAIFGISREYQEDTDDRKQDLVIGAYRDNDGKPVVFDCVREAGVAIYSDTGKYNKEYLAIDGSPEFRRLSQQLIFGDSSEALAAGRVATVQSMSGTGALTIVGHTLRHILGQDRTVYLSDPTWANHDTIFQELLGFKTAKYPYWDASKLTCDVPRMIEFLGTVPEQSIIVLHACAHNPTGSDPTKQEWQKIMEVVQQRNLFALLDCAYQGFASKDLEKDAQAIRMFDAAGLEFAVCQSYAKNMGLYGERAGCAHIVCENKEIGSIVQSRMKRFCRTLWSNPAKHGAELATMVLSNEKLRKSWEAQLAAVSDRIVEARAMLRAGLEERKVPGTWNHLTEQIGMFSYTGLNEEQVERLRKEFHVYMLKSGRISMAGINARNVNYICDAIYKVLNVEGDSTDSASD